MESLNTGEDMQPLPSRSQTISTQSSSSQEDDQHQQQEKQRVNELAKILNKKLMH